MTNVQRDLASADYLRSIGTEEELIPYMVEQELAARRNDAESQAQAQLITQRDRIIGMYEAGEIESLKAVTMELAANGQHALAESLIGYGRVTDDEGETEDWETLAALEETPWRDVLGLVHTQRMTAEQQAAAAEQEKANARGAEILQAGVDVARGYDVLGIAGIAEAAARAAAQKLVSGEANPANEIEMRQLVDDAAYRAAVDRKALERVDATLDAKWKAHVSGLGGRVPWQTDAQAAAAKESWLAVERVHELAKHQPTEADYRRPPTAEEERIAAVERVKADTARKSPVGEIDEAGDGPFERGVKYAKTGEFGLAEQFSKQMDKTEVLEAVRRAEEAAGFDQSVIKTGYSGSTPGAVVVNDNDAP